MAQVKAQVTPDTAVVTTCAHGRRGGEAASRLASCGFKQVVNLEGGLANWADQALPTEGSIQRHH
jgi:rhodanese-related sulfurtransferase